MKLRFFIDFDGTITQGDVVDKILERFGLSQWTELETLWLEGRIGSRECLARQMDLVSASQEEFKTFLDEIKIDPYFGHFLTTAQEQQVPVAIVSDGFDLVINHVLKNSLRDNPGLLDNLPIYCNRLKHFRKSLKAVFPNGPVCEHACANCKERVIRRVREEGEKVIFIGDGLSDRFAAQVSDLTFAKGKLLKFCRDHKIKHREYLGFKEIEQWLCKARKDFYAYV
jgi:2,3-diketo-5-methylthio-1-phosphopentane phosphatase